jgi:SAM-dependent methyltransferase
MPISDTIRILELACGKGAVSINVAKSLNVEVYGIDLTPEFIEYTDKKAKEMQVDSLCHFKCVDANEAVISEKDYDCVILGGAGNILGTWQETLVKKMKTIKLKGYILIDESYLSDDSSNEELKFKYEHLTHEQWLCLFRNTGLELLVEEADNTEEYDFDFENKAISTRAAELINIYPEKRALFESYVQSQLNQCADMVNNLVNVTWLLQKS